MKNLIHSLVAAALLAGGHGANAGPTLDRIRQTKVLVNVVDPSYPPFTFLNEQNQMDGFDIDVAKEVAKRLGATLRVETPSWEIVTSGHWRGRWDVCICSLTPDQQKSQVLRFVAPYYSSPAVLVTTAPNTAIQSAKDLTGKRIGVEQGSSYERYLQKNLVLAVPDAKPLSYAFGEIRIAPYGSEDLAFQDLSLGAGKRIDAVVSNYATARLRLNKQPGKFKLVGEPLYSEPNWIAIDKDVKGDEDWQQTLAGIVAELRRDGTLARISKKWLGDDITR